MRPGHVKPFDEALFDAAPDIAQGTDARLNNVLFNAEVTERPSLVATCRTESDVQRAVATAAAYGVPVSVLAGGHDLAGRAFRNNGLLLDIRAMSDVTVDATRRTVTVQGAALASDILSALPDDIATVTGTIRSVGLVGLAVGGGYGRLNSRFGLAADCIESARVVLADGRVVTASDSEDADLLWALRGGGSGFGVVTSMTMKTFHLPRVLTATILTPLRTAKQALVGYQAAVDEAPDHLSIFAGFTSAPSGERVFFTAPLWTGDETKGNQWIINLSKHDGAQVVAEGWSTYADSFDEKAEAAWPKGGSYHMETQTIPRIDDTLSDLLIAGATQATAPGSSIVLHDFRGFPTRVPSDATAFPLRRPHIVVECIAAWTGMDDAVRHRNWAQDLARALAPSALPGGYTSLLHPCDADRVSQFYGAAVPRLRAVKHRVDPHDLFNCGIGRLTESSNDIAASLGWSAAS